MKNRPSFDWRRRAPKLLRLAILACAAVMVLGLIAGGVIDTRADNLYGRVSQERSNALQAIVHQLEYDGLSDASKQSMSDFAAKYNDFSNFVVIDSGFRVLYSLNQGYLDSSGTFFAAYDESNHVALICDSSGAVLSRHSLDAQDLSGFARLSTALGYAAKTANEGEPVPPMDLYMDGNYYRFEVSGGRWLDESTMFYAGVASKNMHLFYIYDQTSPKWMNHLDTRAHRNAARTIYGFALAAFLIYWCLLPVWVFMDAAKRDNHPALWGILTLFTNAVGLIVYLVARPEKPACKQCGEPLSMGFVVCPLCGARNKDQCCSCGRIIEQGWLWCPYCGRDLSDGPAPAPAPDTEPA